MKEKIRELLELAKEETKDYSDNEKLGMLLSAGLSIDSLMEAKKFEEAIEVLVKAIAVQ